MWVEHFQTTEVCVSRKLTQVTGSVQLSSNNGSVKLPYYIML